MIQAGIYKHHKGKYYQVIGTVTHSETRETCVLYRTLYNNFDLFIRPYSMFIENGRFTKVRHSIIEASSAYAIYEIIKNADEESEILFDIDDTLITPLSSSFRVSAEKQITSQIKQEKEKYSNYETIISHWRLNRKIVLTDKLWPSIIKKIQQTFPVYALTKIECGKVGNIESMQDWRYNELKNLGIKFTQNNLVEDLNEPSFYRGIFITGKYSKKDTLKKYKFLQNKNIIMIDDRLDMLEDIMDYCIENNCNFLGIKFNNQVDGKYDEKLANFQKEYLTKNTIWLEDFDAYKMMGKDAKNHN